MARIVSLRDLANRHGSDKGDRVGSRNNYTALYDLLFFSRRLERITLLEIGLALGGPEGGGPIERTANAPSIAMWLDYFPNAEIYGFDISGFSHLRHPRFHFIRGDLSSVDDLKRLAEVVPNFDIIIDDGSHASYHQQLALGILFPRLASGGFYIIENLHWQSPVYEAALPAVPKTAELLRDAFIASKPVSGSAALPLEHLRAIAARQPACSLFPSFNDDGFTCKLAVLRPTAGANDSSRPSVRSFDLFDTLVARRCHEAVAVFHAMEQRTGFKGFAACRRAAEAKLYGTAYTLADIYQSLAQGTGLKPDVVNHLLNFELEIEREVLFPIAETCASFRPGDIVVSDMYLPPAFLLDLVQRVCALPAARVFASAEGKKTGQIWPVIRQDFNVTQHVGDNPATDIGSAQAAGIPAKLVTVANRTRVEADLADAGYVPLSNLVREARLRGWSSDPAERRLQLLQVQVNFPLLFVATLRLAELAAEHGWQRVLFSGRDCYLWNELYAMLAPLLGDVPSGVYFHSSRMPRAHPSTDYLRYFASLRGDDLAVVADLAGTGWSLNRLIERSPGPPADIFLLHHLLDSNLRAYYEQQAAIETPIEPIACVRRGILKAENEVLEELNRAPFPLLLDVEATQNGFRPVFEKAANQAAAGAVLQIHHAAFRSALMLLYGVVPEALAEMRRGNHAAMVVRLYQEMEGQASNVPHFFPRKWHEEKIFREKIEAARVDATA
ncbi:MAG TPA: hypothetical protein VGG99_01370 [Acetobacteraceae bacterium]|jgi:hypothetical protein